MKSLKMINVIYDLFLDSTRLSKVFKFFHWFTSQRPFQSTKMKTLLIRVEVYTSPFFDSRTSWKFHKHRVNLFFFAWRILTLFSVVTLWNLELFSFVKIRSGIQSFFSLKSPQKVGFKGTWGSYFLPPTFYIWANDLKCSWSSKEAWIGITASASFSWVKSNLGSLHLFEGFQSIFNCLLGKNTNANKI